MVPLPSAGGYNKRSAYRWKACEPTLPKGTHSVRHISPKDAAELDAIETREWLDSVDYVLESGGPVKVARLLRELTQYAKQKGGELPFTANNADGTHIPFRGQ